MKDPQNTNPLEKAFANDEDFLAFIEQQVRSDGYRRGKARARQTPHPAGDTLYEYVLDLLDESEAQDIREHLAACGECTREALSLMQDEEELNQIAEDWANTAPLKDRLKILVSELWTPRFVLQPATAAPESGEEQTFKIGDSDITISCSVRGAYRQKPAHITIKWDANLVVRSEIRVRFLKPDTQEILKEVCLGTEQKNEKTFTSQDLGFDPSQKEWAITIVLQEVNASHKNV